MTVYDTDGLLKVHNVTSTHLVSAAQVRLHGNHPVHLRRLEAVKRTKRRIYIHYVLRHQATRHGMLVRSYA